MDCDFAILLGKKASEELEEIIKEYERYSKMVLKARRRETIRKFRKLIRRRVHGKC